MASNQGHLNRHLNHNNNNKIVNTNLSDHNNSYGANIDDADKSQLINHFNDDNNNNGINSNNNHSRISSSQNISRYVLRTFGGMFDNAFVDEDNESAATTASSYYRMQK